MTDFDSRKILGSRIHACSYETATAKVMEWAKAGETRSVYASNVHMVMEAYDDPAFRDMLNRTDLVTPDGVPLVWMLRALGIKSASRVYGPDLSMCLYEAAARDGVKIGFFGGRPEVLEILKEKLPQEIPGLEIAYAYSPPFRPMTEEEVQQVADDVRAADVPILFIGLGCPKQEKFIDQHKDKFNAVLLGVGAAFDFHAGSVKQAPDILQKSGMEWAFRLVMEPKRLWKRYAIHNPRFVLFTLMQLLRLRRFDRPQAQRQA